MLRSGQVKGCLGGPHVVVGQVFRVNSNFLESQPLLVSNLLLRLLLSSLLLGFFDAVVDGHLGLMLHLLGVQFIKMLRIVSQLDNFLFFGSLASGKFTGRSDFLFGQLFSGRFGCLGFLNSYSGTSVGSVDVSFGSVLLLVGDFIGLNFLFFLKLLGCFSLELEFLNLFSSSVVVASADATAALVWVLHVQLPHIEVVNIFKVIEVRCTILYLTCALVWAFALTTASFSVDFVVEELR